MSKSKNEIIESTEDVFESKPRKAVRFQSKFREPVYVMKPSSKVMIDGQLFTQQGKSIRFSNFIYETAQDDEIEFLRNHRLFGADIFEI